MNHLGTVIAVASVIAFSALMIFVVVPAIDYCSCVSNVKVVTIPSINLYSSNDSIVFNALNPGSATSITSIHLSSSAQAGTQVYNCQVLSTKIPSGLSWDHSCEVESTVNLGQQYNFEINFANSQFVSGWVVGQ